MPWQRKDRFEEDLCNILNNFFREGLIRPTFRITDKGIEDLRSPERFYIDSDDS